MVYLLEVEETEWYNITEYILMRKGRKEWVNF